MTQDPVARAEALLEALPFIQKFAGQRFVIKYGGSAMEDEAVVARLLRDVAFLAAVGIRPILVHGGGKAITQRMREAGLKARFVNGLRVTDAQTIGLVEEVLDTVINPGIVRQLRELGARAEGIPGRQVIRARKLPPQSEGQGPAVDLGFTGEVTAVALEPVEAALAAGALPVLSPLGQEESGATLNINADTAAGTVAAGLGAAKMIYLSDVPGLMRDPEQKDSLIPSVNREKIEQLIKEGIIAGGMIPKVRSALEALGGGVQKVHFIDGRTPHALLVEIFTGPGIGTEIVP